jgi:uncharacterized protein YndB with AHSA1/START domain
MAIRLQCREVVDAPPERVFPALADPEMVARWMPGFVRFERLTEGPVGAGSRFREVRRMFGREAAEVFEVREFDPPRTLGLFVDGRNGSSKKGEFHFVYRLEGRGGRTEVVLDGEVAGMGRFLEFLGRLLAGTMRKSCDRDLAAMKAFVEKGSG